MESRLGKLNTLIDSVQDNLNMKVSIKDLNNVLKDFKEISDSVIKLKEQFT